MPSRSMRPRKSTRAPITFASSIRAGALGPSPATRSGISARAAASIAVSTPFSDASRAATRAYSPPAALLSSANASAGR